MKGQTGGSLLDEALRRKGVWKRRREEGGEKERVVWKAPINQKNFEKKKGIIDIFHKKFREESNYFPIWNDKIYRRQAAVEYFSLKR